ncbi:uncharacterized protein LOC123883145 isoform X2 [Trifolium pratense]|uniref:uncharacterized protein LOC123883145 isoform X2 n=1 Tax=Trifolium pratense TaxID=57577 RepID=UPI001E693DB6|nr:uncharacterized protein LOC123883145 isoform X2 [Trifolium pratense]
MLLMSSSSIVCGSSSTKFMVPLSLPPSFNIKHRKKGLVFDYCGFNKNNKVLGRRHVVIKASSDVASPSFWENFKPPKSSSTHSFSDILWPSAAMAILGKLDQLLTPKGLSITVAPLGAVSAILFATPQAPSARKYNMLMAQIGCAAIGVLAFTLFGPGWLAKSASVAACVAYMIYTDTIHPPAVSMPLLFIDGVKLQHLSFWYVLYPGAAGCILLCFIQEVVLYMKKNFKF